METKLKFKKIAIFTYASFSLVLAIACGSANQSKSQELQKNSRLSEDSSNFPKMSELLINFKENKTEFDNQISYLDHAYKLTISKDYLREFSSNLKADSKDFEENFNTYLRVLNELFPKSKIFRYFHDEDTKNVLNIEGLRALTQHEFYLKNVTVIDIKELPKKLDELSETTENGEFIFLIKHHNAKHVVSLFSKKYGNNVSMVITDSAGITSKIEWIKKLSNYIGASKLKNSTVYSLGFKRQTDGISCPTISILDILESSKSNIFDFVEKLVIEKPKSVISTPMSGLNNFFLINEYPPSFMKVTQSLSAINTYNETYPEYRDIDLTGNNENLKKVIASQTEKGWVDISGSLVLKDVNFYTRKKGFEYMNTVVQHILEGQER